MRGKKVIKSERCRSRLVVAEENLELTNRLDPSLAITLHYGESGLSTRRSPQYKVHPIAG